MNSSRSQLIAQINKIEQNLYDQKEQIRDYKKALLNHMPCFIAGLAIALSLYFLFTPKKNLKRVFNSSVNIGKLTLLNYFKKQITRSLNIKV